MTDFDDHPPTDLTHPTPGGLCFTNAEHPIVSVQDDIPSNSNRSPPTNSSGGEEIPTEIDSIAHFHPVILGHWENALCTGNGEAPETGFLFPCG